ncbi:GINS helical bundle-like domain superfamily [Arabidopsis thaliana x Arabidopsis arenosa]|uniref:GINS helical bundle-like domain superfamily n=1 Tax=Arabidopsis thaliana x Arabidopsis arenosa TaxID=1240361 RepID=A0A8T2A9R0_9BRAS|nr:GINS helical bundle-like domain superfamily [Arabidopsis thaliana x Arabidopsis arenosa]
MNRYNTRFSLFVQEGIRKEVEEEGRWRKLRTRLEIQADAACVDLSSCCPYFYEFGCKLVSLVKDKTIGILLSTAFKIRYKETLTKVYTAAHITACKYLSSLTIVMMFRIIYANHHLNHYHYRVIVSYDCRNDVTT